MNKNPKKRQCTCSDEDPPYSIVVRLNEKRLYLYRGGKLLKIYPVAVGAPGSPTPKGAFKIINKDDTPGLLYGTAWMGLSVPHIGIHGTNKPESIGLAASDGCVRMFNRDVEELFYSIPLGTEVVIQ